MYISKITLVNYRNFRRSKFLFRKGINTVIGENASGKTNLFRAIRLLLDENLLRFAYHLNEDDFCRGLNGWKGHWIIINIEFSEISPDESIQALFSHGVGNIENDGRVDKANYCLIFRPNAEKRKTLSRLDEGDTEGLSQALESISIDDYETIFTGRSEGDFADELIYRQVVGDFENVLFPEDDSPLIGVSVPKQLSVAKEISFTFIKALRDVVSDFNNNRINPLLALLRSRSDELDEAEFVGITSLVEELNKSIVELEDVRDIRNDIAKTIDDAVGSTYSPSSLSIRSDLPTEADKLFRALKLFVGEGEDIHEGAIHDLSLGGANLIFLTLKLLEFKYQKAKESFANFLVIEEPEAHIHTHIQKALFKKLKYDNTQIIYSTHSTHISEASNIRSMNILMKEASHCEVCQPSTGLREKEIDRLERYLDAVRTNLLFAKSVILVEGDAEEILVPILVERVLGVSLDELGISIINLRSTGFENVARIFGNQRLRRRCCILTDLDKSLSGEQTTASKIGKTRKNKLDKFSSGNEWVQPFYAEYTFEVDFVAAGNSHEAIATVAEVYSNEATWKAAECELENVDVSVFGKRILKMANYLGKGWFATLLGEHVKYWTVIPNYITQALAFASRPISDELIGQIVGHRIKCIKTAKFGEERELEACEAILASFRGGKISMNAMKEKIGEPFIETDSYNYIFPKGLI